MVLREPPPDWSTRRSLKDMWRQLRLPAPLALLAVGRATDVAELYPHSDIDVLVLLPGFGFRRPPRPKIEEARRTSVGTRGSSSPPQRCATVRPSVVEEAGQGRDRDDEPGSRRDCARRKKPRFFSGPLRSRHGKGNCLDAQVFFFKAKRLGSRNNAHTKFQEQPLQASRPKPQGSTRRPARPARVIPVDQPRPCRLGNSWAELAQARALITSEGSAPGRTRPSPGFSQKTCGVAACTNTGGGAARDRAAWFDYQERPGSGGSAYSPTAHPARPGEQLMQGVFPRRRKAVTPR